MAPPKIDALDHLVLTVADLAASIDFYTRVLGCTEVSYGAGRKALRFGDQKINLHPAHPRRTDIKLVATHPTPGSADLCFLTSTPVAEWVAHLERHGVALEAPPSERVGATGPLRSIYCRDPDRNLIEISNRLPA
jgi:catechol 2,3-dioxygenase-like lactoylglutathione lyase family enzyme